MFRTKLLGVGLVAVVALALWSVLPAQADAVLIGFRARPNAAVVKAVGGAVKHIYDIVPAIAAEVPKAKLPVLRRAAGVAYIEPDYEVYASESLVAQEVSALFDPATETLPWGIARIGAPQVWLGIPGLTPPNMGEGVKVAVIDTGIDYTHPDLAANYVMGYDFVSEDWDPRDDNGHGTHVAGTIAALDDGPNYGGGNTAGISVVGTGPKISLYIAKSLNSNGVGATSDIVAALNMAAKYKVQVVNMSFGSFFSSRTLKRACDNAYAAGVLLVAAAGNESLSSLSYPARYPSVIAVGATNSANTRAYFSNYGSGMELSAPGVGVLSTLPMYSVQLNQPTSGGYQQIYDYLSGTSMASPHVVGAAALVWAAHPTWTNVQVRQRLTATATDLGAPGWDKYYGYGLVNAAAAAQ